MRRGGPLYLLLENCNDLCPSCNSPHNRFVALIGLRASVILYMSASSTPTQYFSSYTVAVSKMANIHHSPPSLEGIIGHSSNFSGVWDPPLSLILGKCDDPGIASSAGSTSVDPPFPETWSFQFTVALAVTLVLLLKLYLTFRRSTPISKAPKPTPPAVPYLIPFLGNLVSYLRDAANLASLIT